MARPDEAEAAGPAAAGSAASVDADSSPWAPPAQRTFRWLWLGVLISYVGTLMQTVGAQWLLLDAPNAAVLVALVRRRTRCR